MVCISEELPSHPTEYPSASYKSILSSRMSRSTTSIELEPYAAFTPIAPAQSSGLHTKSDDVPLTDRPQLTISVNTLQEPSKGTTAIVLVTVVCVTMSSALLAGLVTVGLPTMAADLDIQPNLLLW